jgi:hypothetical protein
MVKNIDNYFLPQRAQRIQQRTQTNYFISWVDMSGVKITYGLTKLMPTLKYMALPIEFFIANG